MYLTCVIICIVIIILFLGYYYKTQKISYIKEHYQIFSSTMKHPEIKLLENNWEIIRNEIPAFNVSDLNQNLTRNIGVWDTDQNKNILSKLNDKVEWVTGWSPGWFHFPIIYLGKPINGIEKILPETAKIIKKIPSIYVAGFSVLLPNTTLRWHADETGAETDSLAVNLGLVSDNSVLHVKGKNNTYNVPQKNGEAIIFDSNYSHQVINHSENIRVILYVDFKVNQVLGTIVKGYGDASKLGFPTVNVQLHKEKQCGIYTAICDIYGECIIAIDKSKKYAEIHFKQFDPAVDNEKYLYLRDLHIMNPKSNNGIIGNYYRGCN